MRFYIVIPAHNEDSVIGTTLQSLIDQTLQPKKIVVVNDNSTDKTETVVSNFIEKAPFISLINKTSSNEHLPGAKIINAFYEGYETLDDNYDVICKFDADLIFPEEYLENIAKHFNEDQDIGMASGFCYIQQENHWVLENLTNKDHIRGALKAYRKDCFLEIGKLKKSIGWDTVDELLAKYYGWHIKTYPELKVKHLKPTGSSYNKASKLLQGEAFYKMRYGFTLLCITALKMAYKKKKATLLLDFVNGFLSAKSKKMERLVTKDQGEFIRRLRWQGIFDMLFLQ